MDGAGNETRTRDPQPGSYDWAQWYRDEKTGEGKQMSFGTGHRKGESKNAALRPVRSGPLDLSRTEHFRLYGDQYFNSKTKKLLEKSEKAHKAKLDKQAKKSFEQAIKIQGQTIYQIWDWQARWNQKDELEKIFLTVFPNEKNSPLYWLDYAIVTNHYLHPALTLQAVQQLQYVLKTNNDKLLYPSKTKKDYLKASAILKASALAQLGLLKEAYGELLNQEIGKNERALYFLNHNGFYLFKDQKRLATVAGVKASRLKPMGKDWNQKEIDFAYTVVGSKPFVNVFTGQTVAGMPQPVKKNVPKSKRKGRILD